MRKIEFKITFLIPFLILPFYFKPYYVMYSNLDSINSVYVYGLRIIFFITLFKYISKKQISKFMIFLGLFYIIKALITIVNNAHISSLITEAYPVLGICMLIEMSIDKNIKQFIKAFTYMFIILTVISFITILINPIGYESIYEKIYFQRPGNQMASFCIMTMFFMIVYTYLTKGKKRTFITWILMILNSYIVIKVNSASGLIAWILLIIYFIIPSKNVLVNIINFKRGIILYITFFIGIIIFKIQDRFSFFIEEILGKSITFTGRTYLWDSALLMIKERLLIGYGMSDSTNVIYSDINGKFLSSHNQFIQLLLEGGIISLVFFLIIIYIVYRQLERYKQSEFMILSTISVFSMCLVLFSEAMGLFDLLVILCVIYNISRFGVEFNSKKLINI